MSSNVSRFSITLSILLQQHPHPVHGNLLSIRKYTTQHNKYIYRDNKAPQLPRTNKQIKREREIIYVHTFARPLPPEQTNKVKGHELP